MAYLNATSAKETTHNNVDYTEKFNAAQFRITFGSNAFILRKTRPSAVTI